MNKTMRRALIWLGVVVGILIAVYFSFVIYMFYFADGGCGMADGPFRAAKIATVMISDQAVIFDLDDNGKLILENRGDTLSPVLILTENGEIRWTLDTDVRHTEGYENSRLWKISDVSIIKRTNPIKFRFTGHWTYGAETGSMKINRKNGDNSFCISW